MAATLRLGRDNIRSVYILLISHVMLYTSFEAILLLTTAQLVGARFVITLRYYASPVHIADIIVVYDFILYCLLLLNRCP